MGCAIPSRIDFNRMWQGNAAHLSFDRMKQISLSLALVALTSVASAKAQDTTAAAADTSYVEYSDSPFSLPLGIGLRIPSYDRVNGVTLPWGPHIETSNGRIN